MSFPGGAGKPVTVLYYTDSYIDLKSGSDQSSTVFSYKITLDGLYASHFHTRLRTSLSMS